MPENRSNCWYENICDNVDSPCSKMTTCPRYLEMSYLMEESGLPKSKQQPITINLYDDCDEVAYERLNEIRENIVDFVDSGKNLVIASKNLGNGKTSWAVKILHKYFERVWQGNHFRVRGLFVHVPTLLIKLKDFNDPELARLKRRLLEVDLVVWDDIASQEISSYDYGNLLMFIDSRMFADKSNIFTTNKINDESFREYVGSKLTSRIFHQSEVIVLSGTDKRGLL